MRQITLSLAMIGIFTLGTVSRADSPSDAHWYCGTYTLKSESAMAKYLGLDTIIVKQLASEQTPLVATLNNGRKFSEMNIPVSFDSTGKKFVFSTKSLNYCEDYDCAGLAAAAGSFERGEKTFREKLTVTFGFFRDTDNIKVREWEETLQYESAPHDGGYCWGF